MAKRLLRASFLSRFFFCAGGELFHHLCKKRVLDAKVTAFYGAEIALALQCAHEAGVVYRDVKPENCAFAASRGAAAPSRHRRDSWPSDEVVAGFFFDSGPIRTASRP